jgi:serine/threonine-protein kinase
VALKLLDQMAGSMTAWKRFARERATLARLQRPHVARLFDAGVTETGTPYLVMEYVEGTTIDRHCETQAPHVEARLVLFRQVCLAVEYAHAQLIVHRDLKPANVLVDRFGQVKLLDLGIAKWLDELGGDSSITQTAHRVLTPGHAAPEQFLGEPVTTATDVYQLGLLLYRLLTGRAAHGAPNSRPEALRSAVLDADPERPSRAATTASLGKRLEGDLDAIILKALRKEPSERYPTVEALRRDLDDYAAHRPVAARRGTTAYVARKYLRRHRVATAAVCAVVVSSTIGLAAVTRQSRLIAAERDRARAAEARAAAINTFLVDDLLAAATPEKARGVTPTVDAVLDIAARSVGQAFRAHPETAAEVRLTLARSYASLGRLASAREHATAAAEALAVAQTGDPLPALRARALVAELTLTDGHYAEARDALAGLLAEQTGLAEAGRIAQAASRSSTGRAAPTISPRAVRSGTWPTCTSARAGCRKPSSDSARRSRRCAGLWTTPNGRSGA